MFFSLIEKTMEKGKCMCGCGTSKSISSSSHCWHAFASVQLKKLCFPAVNLAWEFRFWRHQLDPATLSPRPGVEEYPIPLVWQSLTLCLTLAVAAVAVPGRLLVMVAQPRLADAVSETIKNEKLSSIITYNYKKSY